MKKLFTLALLIFIISCRSMSESEMKVKAKQGIVEYFKQKHGGVIIDSLKVMGVKPVKQGPVVYKAEYTIQTTEASNKDLLVKINIMQKDVAYMDKDFNVIDEQ